jgi:ubiquinone/menaquinone biosynthesis C-methylase UbiE
MGELFERLVPAVHFDWTRERPTTAASGQVEVEDVHQYLLARHFCRGQDVLDLASGEGYGSAILAQVARSVIGVEIDPAAVQHARKAYVLDTLRYETGDARSIPLPDESVDRVVSFKTIERFYEQDVFVSEVRRVLRPGGIFICGSSDRDHCSSNGARPNPSHVRELTREEFEALLSKAFAYHRLLAQRPIVGSVLMPMDDDGPAKLVTYDRRGPDRFEVSEGMSRPLSWVALASDQPLPPAIQSCYFDLASVDDAIASPAIRRVLDEARRSLSETQSLLANQDEELAEARYHLERLNQYIWTRVGLYIDRIISFPLKLFGIGQGSKKNF